MSDKTVPRRVWHAPEHILDYPADTDAEPEKSHIAPSLMNILIYFALAMGVSAITWSYTISSQQAAEIAREAQFRQDVIGRLNDINSNVEEINRRLDTGNK